MIAISGFGGAGKSTLAAALSARIQPAAVVTADGFWINRALGRSADWSSLDRGADITPLFDFTVWIDADPAAAMASAIQRNVQQGDGPEDELLWRTVWAPNDADFFAKYRPDAAADFVVGQKGPLLPG